MRIVGGELRGRRFTPPAKNWPTRPTTDQSKEALFNILNNRIYFEDIKILDLFGGTGNLSYEFISRGCTDATYVDNFRKAVAYVQRVSKELGIEDRLKVVNCDVFRFIKTNKLQYDLIFADPPYALSRLKDIPDMIFESDMLASDGLLILEHDKKHRFVQHERYLEERKYGSTLFTFFK